MFWHNSSNHANRDVILDPEKGRNPREVVASIVNGFKEEFGDVDPLEVEAIRGMNLKDLFQKYGASDKEVSGFKKFSLLLLKIVLTRKL